MKASKTSATNEHSISEVESRFAYRVSTELETIIARTGKTSPVARQYLPDIRELDIIEAETSDPIGDHPHSPVKGIVHRYDHRALLKITNVCAVNCRFCFRKDMLGTADESLDSKDLQAALDYLRAHTEINEVILTGGDPLVLSQRRLAALFETLSAIDHIDIIRIHTRLPVAAPSKMPDLTALNLPEDKALFIVLHINHADEITDGMKNACKALKTAGFTILTQSVLLKGVNNTHEALHILFTALIKMGVKPYYLHHPDLVSGTSHFRVSFEDGMALMKQLQRSLSGIAIPQYVLDIPGGFGKVPVTPDYVRIIDDRYIITDPKGHEHIYPLPKT